MFLYRPISQQKFSSQVFYTFAYFVPETIPSLLQIYISETSRGQELENTKFIDDLYAQSHDSIEDYKENKLTDENTKLVE